MTILLTEEEILGEDIWLKAGVLAHYALAVKNNREPKEPEELMARRQIAKAQAKKIFEWGEGICTDRSHSGTMKKRECGFCWQALKKEIE